MPNPLSTLQASSHPAQKGLRSMRFDWFNFFVRVLLAFYLLPIAFMIVTAFMSTEELSDPHAPLYPAKAVHFTYQGKNDLVYDVPSAQGLKQWALVQPRPDVFSSMITVPSPSSTRVASGEISLSVTRLLLPARLFAQPCTR